MFLNNECDLRVTDVSSFLYFNRSVAESKPETKGAVPVSFLKPEPEPHQYVDIFEYCNRNLFGVGTA
jgi:hypothetical protein